MALRIIISAFKLVLRLCCKKTPSLKTPCWSFTQKNQRSSSQRKLNCNSRYYSICMNLVSSPNQISIKSKSIFSQKRNDSVTKSWFLKRSTRRDRTRKSRNKRSVVTLQKANCNLQVYNLQRNRINLMIQAKRLNMQIHSQSYINDMYIFLWISRKASYILKSFDE